MITRELSKLEVLVVESPVAAWLKLEDGRFLAFSPCLADGLGLVPSDAPRADDEEFFTAAEVKRFRLGDKRACLTGRPQVTLEPPDSLTPEAWGATLKIPICSRSGATVGFSLSLNDLLPLEQLVGGDGGGRPGASFPLTADRIRDHLDRSFQGQIRVSDLARAFRRHPDHLASCFRHACGATIDRYLRARRVAWAAIHLPHSERTIAVLALDAGFYDQSHLTRAFGEVLGTTPGQYRQYGSTPSGYRRLARSRAADPMPSVRAVLRIATGGSMG